MAFTHLKCFVLILLASLPAIGLHAESDETRKARKDYESKIYKLARQSTFDELRQKSAKGDLDAKRALAEKLDNTNFVFSVNNPESAKRALADIKEAIRINEELAEIGDLDAMIRLADYYKGGRLILAEHGSSGHQMLPVDTERMEMYTRKAFAKMRAEKIYDKTNFTANLPRNNENIVPKSEIIEFLSEGLFEAKSRSAYTALERIFDVEKSEGRMDEDLLKKNFEMLEFSQENLELYSYAKSNSMLLANAYLNGLGTEVDKAKGIAILENILKQKPDDEEAMLLLYFAIKDEEPKKERAEAMLAQIKKIAADKLAKDNYDAYNRFIHIFMHRMQKPDVKIISFCIRQSPTENIKANLNEWFARTYPKEFAEIQKELEKSGIYIESPIKDRDPETDKRDAIYKLTNEITKATTVENYKKACEEAYEFLLKENGESDMLAPFVINYLSDGVMTKPDPVRRTKLMQHIKNRWDTKNIRNTCKYLEGSFRYGNSAAACNPDAVKELKDFLGDKYEDIERIYASIKSSKAYCGNKYKDIKLSFNVSFDEIIAHYENKIKNLSADPLKNSNDIYWAYTSLLPLYLEKGDEQKAAFAESQILNPKVKGITFPNYALLKLATIYIQSGSERHVKALAAKLEENFEKLTLQNREILAYIYENGIGVKKDTKRAKEIRDTYPSIADKYCNDSLNLYWDIWRLYAYEFYPFKNKPNTETLKSYLEKSTSGNPYFACLAYSELGKMAISENEYDKANEYFEKLYEKARYTGSPSFSIPLCAYDFYMTSPAEYRDEEKAFNFLLANAKDISGDDYAHINLKLAMHYLRGVGTQKNDTLAFETLRRGVNKNMDSVDAEILACFYENGIGTKKDSARAAELRKLSRVAMLPTKAAELINFYMLEKNPYSNIPIADTPLKDNAQALADFIENSKTDYAVKFFEENKHFKNPQKAAKIKAL